MKASTEKERASLSAFIEMAEREGFDTAHQWYDAKGWVFFSPPTADCWRYWQAARRAPAVPTRKQIEQYLYEQGAVTVSRDVAEAAGLARLAGEMQSAPAVAVPQGYRLQPLSEYDAMCEFISAAPQPPEATVKDSLTVEAAPVQMPEPDGYIMDSLPNGRLEYKRGPLSQMDSICNSTMPVYEYGTMRQLLAAHGITQGDQP